jgi:hypothetical protein
MKCMIAALSVATLFAGTALAQTSPPRVVTQPMQSGAVTNGTSSAVTPRLDADKKETDKKEADKKDGTAAAQGQTAGEEKAPKPDRK